MCTIYHRNIISFALKLNSLSLNKPIFFRKISAPTQFAGLFLKSSDAYVRNNLKSRSHLSNNLTDIAGILTINMWHESSNGEFKFVLHEKLANLPAIANKARSVAHGTRRMTHASLFTTTPPTFGSLSIHAYTWNSRFNWLLSIMR